MPSAIRPSARPLWGWQKSEAAAPLHTPCRQGGWCQHGTTQRVPARRQQPSLVAMATSSLRQRPLSPALRAWRLPPILPWTSLGRQGCARTLREHGTRWLRLPGALPPRRACSHQAERPCHAPKCLPLLRLRRRRPQHSPGGSGDCRTSADRGGTCHRARAAGTARAPRECGTQSTCALRRESAAGQPCSVGRRCPGSPGTRRGRGPRSPRGACVPGPQFAPRPAQAAYR
mmetsp:Transcript_78839/g.222945  ORF Transcript_78839/g.222945 Transcript_78839/m.222945 type:complete len:230 (+) Transcript_78839:253-942(+)